MSDLVPVKTDIEPRRTGPLVPLAKPEVALMEAQAHALGLPSLVSLAEGISDDDIPFPMESSEDYLGFDSIEAEFGFTTGEESEWD